MRDVLVDLNKELERDRGVTIAVRIGVNTGEVVAGDPTTGQALVTGDAVNVAPRLEERAAPGEILMSEADAPTRARRRRSPTQVEPVALKGKVRQVQAWRRPRRAGRDERSMPRRLDSPMVGRERPLAQLAQAYEAAVEDDGVPALHDPRGPPGSGSPVWSDEFVSGLGERSDDPAGPMPPLRRGHHVLPRRRGDQAGVRAGRLRPPRGGRGEGLRGPRGRRASGDRLPSRGAADRASPSRPRGDETFWAIRRFFEASARDRPAGAGVRRRPLG